MALERGTDHSRDAYLPLAFHGQVVKGYQRGGSQLGFPTANLSPDCFADKITANHLGVYYGWAKLDGCATVEPMVMSVGYNPHFGNQELSVEVHILKQYEADFYGTGLKALALGYIRNMCKFNSFDDLIAAIKADIDYAKERLRQPEAEKEKSRQLFK